MFMPLFCHPPTSLGQKRLNALVTIVTASLLLPFAVAQMAMSEVSVNPVYLAYASDKCRIHSFPVHTLQLYTYVQYLECIDLVYV